MYDLREIVEYMVILIGSFAKRYNISDQEAQAYLSRYGALDMIQTHYGIMHTQRFEDMVEGLTVFCKRNGGNLS